MTITEAIERVEAILKLKGNFFMLNDDDEAALRWSKAALWDCQDEERDLCLCNEDCQKPCKGKCGCDACAGSYADFLSSRDE